VGRLVQEDHDALNVKCGDNGDADTWKDGLPIDECTPLMLAAWRGHDAVVARLLTSWLDVEMGDIVGETAAHWACSFGHAPILSLLLDAGAKPDDIDSGEWTLLMFAADSGATECMRLLVAWTPEDWEWEEDEDVLRLNAQQDEDGGTALHLTQEIEIVRMLLQAGADPTIRDWHDRTPLDVARARGNAQCIALLEASIADHHRARILFRVRALNDTAYAVPAARRHAINTGEPPAMQQEKTLAAAPPYLQGRVAEGRPLPRVDMTETTAEAAAAAEEAVGGEEALVWRTSSACRGSSSRSCWR
jgi:hypothetical protein